MHKVEWVWPEVRGKGKEELMGNEDRVLIRKNKKSPVDGWSDDHMMMGI